MKSRQEKNNYFMKKLVTFFLALAATTALWASNTITYTATEKLSGYYGSLNVGKTTFGSVITSHTFADDTGSITCSGEITTIGSQAFCGCSGLTSIEIPNSVISIGGGAFDGCSGLSSIEIPNSVTSIGGGAFYNCSGLTSVTIPNSVTTIGSLAFYDCSSLTSINVDVSNTHYCSMDGVLFNYTKDTLIQYPSANTQTKYTIPNSVTSIGASAFRNCNCLTSIIIPNSVTTIEYGVFYGCSGLTSVIIPNSVTTIGEGAFQGCSSLPVIDNLRYADTYLIETIDRTLSTYTIKEGTKWIGTSAFDGCYRLTSVTIGNSVTTIGEMAFYGCSGLTSIEIPNSVSSIGDWAFYGCSGLTSATIPNSVTTIGNLAFYDCNSLASVTLNANAIVDKTYTSSNNIKNIFGTQVTEYIIGDSVTTIGNSSFSGCSSLTSITIGNSVTTIGDYAFEGCSWLISVTIPNSVTTIGKGAFEGCSRLASVTIGNSVTTIGEEAFEFCKGLTSIIIPNSVTTIGERAFCGCSGLTSVSIPNSVTTIGEGAFYGCSGLTSPIYNSYYFVYMPKSYSGSYTIPDGIKQVVESAFSSCESLTFVIIPNSVTTIEYGAFAGCSGLTSVTIPNSVTTIGEMAFYGCSSLPVFDNLRYADTYLIEVVDKTLSTYTIKEETKWIGDWAFYGCSGLTSVSIPNSVTTIEYGAFAGCSGLTSVTIGNSITMIGDAAFADCSGLTSITCYAVTPPECGNGVFKYISQDAKVYVPMSSLTDYQNAEGWKDLQLYPIIAADTTPMDDENPVVTPTDQDVTITWPITEGTDTYTLTITKNGEIVCVLTFNANGQLTNIAFAAPGRDGAHQAPAATLTAQGYQFTVTGLNPGTAYNYSVTATDAGGKTIAEHKGNFSTTGGTGLNTLPYEGKDRIGSKYLHNGNLIIERNGVKYTATGQKVR